MKKIIFNPLNKSLNKVTDFHEINRSRFKSQDSDAFNITFYENEDLHSAWPNIC